MVTSIQITNELKNALNTRKMSPSDTYEDIIWDLLEDRMELSDETKKGIIEAEKDVAAGRLIPIERIKRKK